MPARSSTPHVPNARHITTARRAAPDIAKETRMQKIHFSRMLPLVLLAAALAACGGTSELKHSSTVADVPAQYDLSLAADKDGQFDYDGATVDKETVRGHIRYLNESGRPVHS